MSYSLRILIEELFLLLQYFEKVGSGIELDVCLLEDVGRVLLLLLLDGDGAEGVASQHLLDVFVLGLDLLLLHRFRTSGSATQLVEFVFDLPTDPHCAHEEGRYNCDVSVLFDR
jgi:hypothetical protein